MGAWLDEIGRDIRFAARGLRRAPGFTSVAVLTLALGIGVNATVFTLTSAVLFKGFPLVAGNDRLLYISSKGYGCCVSYPDFEDWRAQATSFQGMAVVHGVGIILSDTGGFPERYDATEVSADTFRLVGQRPIVGRDFTASDDRTGAAPVAILSYGFWDRRYAMDPTIIGRTIRIDGTPTTVIGVMARGFSFPQTTDIWIPLIPTADVRKRETRNLWFAFGRMNDGATVESARAEMDIIGRRLARAHPRTNEDNPPIVQTFHEFFVGRNSTTIYETLWGAVGFVLLIACANIANLLLGRAMSRSREMSVRIALGAGRWRIIRQSLVESVMLSSAGGLIGWWMIKWGVRAYSLAMAHKSPWLVLDYSMDAYVVGYLLAVSVGTGLLFGLAPAFSLARLDIHGKLKDGGRGAAGRMGGRRLSDVLVTMEMALAVVLLAGAGVTIRSFLNIYTANIGVETTNVLTADIGLPAGKYASSEAQISFFDRLQTRLASIPGVNSIAIAERLPTTGSAQVPYEWAGAPAADERRRPLASTLTIGPGYFRTVGATVLSGREFNDFDDASGVQVVIVNERFARQQWPGDDPLGRRLRVFDRTTPDAWRTVVGVVSNIVQNDTTRQRFDPVLYVPYRQRPAAGMWVLGRTHVPPETLGTAFRREVQALDPDLPIFGPFTLAERLDTWNYWSNGIIASLFMLFAAIALLLASAGLYAIIAQAVSQRTQEIGVRIAIGATARDILALVFTQGIPSLGVGLAVGLSASFAVTRLLRSMLVQVSPVDPMTMIAALAALVAAAALGCLMPARRALRIDPVVALRHE